MSGWLLPFVLSGALMGAVTPSGVELERVVDNRSYQPPGLPGQFLIGGAFPVTCGESVVFAGSSTLWNAPLSPSDQTGLGRFVDYLATSYAYCELESRGTATGWLHLRNTCGTVRLLVAVGISP